MNEVYLVIISYAIIATFFVMELAFAFYTSVLNRYLASGYSLVFIYLTYSMLPVRLREALIGGILLSLTHIITIVVYTDSKVNSFKLICITISLICTNSAGVFTHWPREKAQRKAFLETRQCIEARLKTQRENQQQVN